MASFSPPESDQTIRASRTNRPPTIDLQIDASHKLALVTGEEGGNVGHVAGVREAAERDVEQELFHVLLVVGHADELLEQARAGEQWAQRVDADLVFAVFGREALGCLSFWI